MRVEWMMLARYAEMQDSLVTMVGGGIDTLWLNELPQEVEVGTVIRVLADAEEFGTDQMHKAAKRVRDPDGQLIIDLSMDDFWADTADPREDYLTGFTLVGQVRFEVREGLYTIEQEIDGVSVTLPLLVVHGERPA